MKKIWEWIKKAAKATWNFFGKIFGWLGSFFKKIGSLITNTKSKIKTEVDKW